LKKLFSIVLYSISLFGLINFTETKYISALDMDFKKHGTLTITKQKLSIVYTKPVCETINYLEDKLEVKNQDKSKIYTFKQYPKTQYMGLILRAIVDNEYQLIENLFSITHKNDTTILKAKPIIDNYITNIQVAKNKKDTIIIQLTNKDRITIETTN